MRINGEFTEIPLISVIVPVYNEEETIGDVLTGLSSLREKMSLEIVVVDDGSRDNTTDIVKKFSSAMLVQHHKNLGKGAAIRTGINHSKGDITVIQDADLEYPPEEICKLVRPIVDGKADVVYGSRFLGRNQGMSLTHKIGNKILSLGTQLLYGARVTDIMTGHKAFSREAITSIDLRENGFEVEAEITCKFLRNNCKLVEVPISYRYRRRGVSKITYKHGLTNMIKLVAERIRPLKNP